MNILVLGGSPKGEASVTLRYIRFLGLKFPEHTFEEVHVATKVRAWERDPGALADLMAKVQAADAVVFAFPLYVFLVHADYKRFFELVEERGLTSAFAGKPALLLATSIHFFDHTALEYVRGMAEDWGMGVCGVHSAEMHDLERPAERDRLEAFGRTTFEALARGTMPQRQTAPRVPWSQTYAPASPVRPVEAQGLKALVLTDGLPGSGTRAMAERFVAAFGGESELVDLNAIDMKGGCRGCVACAFDNECIYGDHDDVQDIYRVKLQRADIVVWAVGIRDRYLSARVKTFIDRRFLDTHQPNAVGKQVLHLISGPLSAQANLRQILEGMEAFNGGNLAATVTDECGDAQAIDGAIEAAIATAVSCHRAGFRGAPTFLGVGGAKVFRDEVWGKLRFVFQADHRYYRRNGFYDFPQKQWRVRLRNVLMTALTWIPPAKRDMRANMPKHMVKPMDAVLESLRGSQGRA